MRFKQISWIAILCLGLCSTVSFAQKKEKIDLSAALSAQVKESDLDKLNYQYVVEVDNVVYSGYSVLGVNPKSIDNVKVHQGTYKVDSRAYDKKIQLTLKENNKANLLLLSQWAKENISFEGNVVFLINGVVLNSKPSQVLLDQNYLLDYEVIALDQLGFNPPTAVVKVRTKTRENFKASIPSRSK